MKKATKGGEEIAVVTIRNPQHLTKRGVRDLVKWLHRTADDVEDLRAEMSRNFRFRYMARTAPKEQTNG